MMTVSALGKFFYQNLSNNLLWICSFSSSLGLESDDLFSKPFLSNKIGKHLSQKAMSTSRSVPVHPRIASTNQICQQNDAIPTKLNLFSINWFRLNRNHLFYIKISIRSNYQLKYKLRFLFWFNSIQMQIVHIQFWFT